MKKAYFLVLLQATLLIAIFAGPAVKRFNVATQFSSLFKPLGLVLLVIGLLFLLLSFGFLGKSLTPNPIPRASGQLVTNGVYSFCRNPIYVALLLMTVGWSLRYLSLISILGSLFLSGVLKWKVDYEEELLRKRYGSEYEAYCKRVGRFFPKWKPWT